MVFLVAIAGLQLFGGRDFSQISAALQKYQHGGTLEILTDDIGRIFVGQTISRGGIAMAELANRVVYRWVDDKGVVQHSERMPNVEKYEVIRMGDLELETQKALDEEEIKKALKQ